MRRNTEGQDQLLGDLGVVQRIVRLLAVPRAACPQLSMDKSPGGRREEGCQRQPAISKRWTTKHWLYPGWPLIRSVIGEACR